jgi:hypothetical protein
MKMKIGDKRLQIDKKKQEIQHIKDGISAHENRVTVSKWTIRNHDTTISDMGVRRYNYAILLSSLIVIPLISGIVATIYNLAMSNTDPTKSLVQIVIFVLIVIGWYFLARRFSAVAIAEPNDSNQNEYKKAKDELKETSDILDNCYKDLEKKNSELDELYKELEAEVKTYHEKMGAIPVLVRRHV